jgi:hypothetical protein
LKRPSFQFYPADWRGTRWVSFDAIEISIIPGKPACYVVYIDGALAYVGQTTNLRKRVSSYRIVQTYGASITTPWGPARRVAIKAKFGVRLGDWAMMEIRLIARLQPPHNCVGGTKRRGVA